MKRAAVIALVIAAAMLAANAVHAAEAEPRALLEKAEALQRLGHRHQALAILEEARLLADAGQDGVLTASIHGALAKAYLLRGRRDEARVLLARALDAAQKQGRQVLAAAVLNDTGNLAAAEGNPAAAIDFFERGLAQARSVDAHSHAATSAANIANVRAGQQDYAGAERALAELDRAIARMADPRERVGHQLAAGELLERLFEAGRGRAFLERSYVARRDALATAGEARDLRSVSLARGGLAGLYRLEGRNSEALALAELALGAAQTADAADLLYRWHWVTARVLAAQGRTEEALVAYRRAAQRFQAVRLDLIQELTASRASYRDAVGPLFTERANLLLRRAKAAGDGQTDLAEARDAIEQVRSIELEDYFQDECVARLQARRQSVETVASDTAVLYPIFLPDRVEVLVSIAGRIRQVTLEVDSAKLGAEIDLFRERLEKRTTNEYLLHAQRLYDWFFRPLESELTASGITTIVLIPDGALRTIPIAALHDGKGFLIDRYAFAVTPGLSLLEPRGLATGGASRALLSGVSEGVQEYPPLPGVVEELLAIGELTIGKTLRDTEFRIPAFEKELRSLPYNIVHIASHGEFDSDPKKSFLLTYDGKINMDDLEALMKLTRFRDQPVELLTLSACRTAAGDERAALGLAGIAIKAGARSALASLWFVSDQASTDLVTHFYELLRVPNTSKVSALQLAQKRMLTDARYRHPSYWAPFLLIGNWL